MAANLTSSGIPYRPLEHTDSLRLLYLWPKFQTGLTIRCDLVADRLSQSAEKYTALSYAWGTTNGPERIFVNEQPCEIGGNLYSYLRTWQDAKDTLILWVDAICINQNDIAERTQQIAMMADIYRSASTVCSWLGQADEETDWLLNEMAVDPQCQQVISECNRTDNTPKKSIASAINDGNVNTSTSSTEGNDDFFEHDASSEDDGLPPEYIERSLRALTSLASRDYFTRLWTVQEVLVSKSLFFLCGARSIHSAIFFTWYELLQAQVPARYYITMDTWEILTPDASGAHLARLLQCWDVYHANGGLRLEDIVDRLKQLRCRDPHDHFFALLGFLSKRNKQSPRAWLTTRFHSSNYCSVLSPHSNLTALWSL